MADLIVIEEQVVAGKRLGRHIRHDPLSLNYPASALVAKAELAQPLKSIEHTRNCPAFDQGDIGSCTGNALAGALMTSPLWKPKRIYNEVTAQTLYSQATHLDPVDGQSWPPNDVGSSGVDVCQAAKKDSYLSSYRHCFDFNTTMTLLGHYPVMIGANWYDSMDSPDSSDVLTISPNAQVRGGHEWCMVGLDPVSKLIKAFNSWGTVWGQNGAFYLSFVTLERLLSEQGDATVPVV